MVAIPEKTVNPTANPVSLIPAMNPVCFETDFNVGFRVILERVKKVVLPVLTLTYLCPQELWREPYAWRTSPKLYNRLYHWSGVVILIGVILVVPTLIMGFLSLRQGKECRSEGGEELGELGGGVVRERRDSQCYP